MKKALDKFSQSHQYTKKKFRESSFKFFLSLIRVACVALIFKEVSFVQYQAAEFLR